MPLGHHSPVLFPLWPQLPTPLPSGTCYSWNTKSCSSQIRPAQGPGEERQPRARLFLKKRLLNFSCSLGGPAAAGQGGGGGGGGMAPAATSEITVPRCARGGLDWIYSRRGCSSSRMGWKYLGDEQRWHQGTWFSDGTWWVGVVAGDLEGPLHPQPCHDPTTLGKGQDAAGLWVHGWRCQAPLCPRRPTGRLPAETSPSSSSSAP